MQDKPGFISKHSLDKHLLAFSYLACGLQYPRHYYEWAKLVDAHKRILVESARDHGKTTFFSVIYPLWQAVKHPGWSISLTSYSEDQSKAVTQKIRTVIEGNDMMRCLRPSNPDQWSKTDLRLTNGSIIKARSFGSAGRGSHDDLVIVDDAVKDFGAMSSDDQWAYFTGVLEPTVKPGCQEVVVGTPVYDGDLLERIRTIPGFHYSRFPAIGMDGKPLWPERYDLSALDERRRVMGEWAFTREYMLERTSPEAAFFKREWVRFYDEMPRSLNCYMSVDPAISADGDFTGIVVCGVDEANRVYVLEYVNARTDDVQHIVNEVFRMRSKWGVPTVIVETIGFQRLLRHWVQDEMRKRNEFFGIQEVKVHDKSKQARIMALQPRFMSGSLLLPKGDHTLLNQLLAFPKGRHDDLIDALAMQLSVWSASVSAGSGEVENSWGWWSQQLPKDSGQDFRQELFADMRGAGSSDTSPWVN